MKLCDELRILWREVLVNVKVLEGVLKSLGTIIIVVEVSVKLFNLFKL